METTACHNALYWEQQAERGTTQQYTTDLAKVFFAISYLKKTTLEWFEHRVMEDNPTLAPAWRTSWRLFMEELRTFFGPANPTGDAEIKLRNLTMQSD